MKISNQLFAFVILLVSITSCKKKLETCSYRIEYHNPSVAFAGFSEADVKSIQIASYKANTNFTELISLDSLSQSSIVFNNDTALKMVDTVSKNLYGFKLFEEGIDYKITCTNTGKSYLVTHVLSGEVNHTWEEVHCSPGSSQTRFASILFDLDGSPVDLSGNDLIFYLSK